MPKDKKVILEAVAEEPVVASATVGDLVSVPETVVSPPPAGVMMPVEVTKVESGGGKLGWAATFLALLVGIAVGAGVGYLIWGSKKEAVVAKPAIVAEPTKTSTPAVEVKRSELKVKVLNGSGVKGAAGIAKDLLESLGYKNVATGNADRNDYEGTSVAVKAGKKAVWEVVKTDLGSKYTVDGEMGVLGEGEGFDAVIILGGV